MHTSMRTPLRHSFRLVVFHEALVPVHPSGVCFPLHFAMFIPVAVPVLSAVFCYPQVHGCFLFVVVSVFPGGSEGFVCTHARAHACVYFPPCQQGFC